MTSSEFIPPVRRPPRRLLRKAWRCFKFAAFGLGVFMAVAWTANRLPLRAAPPNLIWFSGAGPQAETYTLSLSPDGVPIPPAESVHCYHYGEEGDLHFDPVPEEISIRPLPNWGEQAAAELGLGRRFNWLVRRSSQEETRYSRVGITQLAGGATWWAFRRHGSDD